MRSLCIIPARGGSKRIPRKNMRLLAGRPLLTWPLLQALKAGLFVEVMVSTDDPEIAAIARAEGASVPFLRSAETSHDHASTTAVIEEVLARYAMIGAAPFDLVCCLYPTAAMASEKHLRTGYELLAGDATLDSCMAVQAYRHPIERALRVRDGKVFVIDPAALARRTQDLEGAFHDAGQFIWVRPQALAANGRLIGQACAPVLLSALEAVDLDNEEDWQLLERLFAANEAAL